MKDKVRTIGGCVTGLSIAGFLAERRDAIFESLSLGLPVLALNRAGPAALLRQGSGFLVPARSRERTVKEFRAALLEIAAQRVPLARASKDGVSAARKLFGWDSRLQTVEQVYVRADREGQPARAAK